MPCLTIPPLNTDTTEHLPTSKMSPPIQTAILTTAAGLLRPTNGHPTPPCPPSALLVKVHAVALNPSDHKMPLVVPTPSLVAGSDFAGEIIEVGSDVNSLVRPRCAPWRVGDRVSGCVLGSNPSTPTVGAFAEYVTADPLVLWRVPERWEWSRAVAVGGCCVAAVGMALFQHMGLDPPSAGISTTIQGSGKKVVLVYGGSTACGTIAIQLLRL
jgi:aspyridone synthetase trans-acting enoyl reductase